MVNPITIFISSAGATNAINVIDALRRSSLSLRLIGGDLDPLAAGLFMIEKGYVLPRASEPEFIPQLLEICARERVDLILPIYSAELPAFARNKDAIESRGIRICVPDEATLALCDDKLRVISVFAKAGVGYPRTWDYQEALGGDLSYPVFLKRREGSGSRGAVQIESAEELSHNLKPGFIVQEYLEGQEFTVDVISDVHGKMIAASPRIRNRIYGGLSIRGTTVRNDQIVEASRRIVESLSLPGPSNLQCKLTPSGELKFFEINPRFASGGLPLAVAAGLNIPEILVRLLMGLELPPINIRDGVVMNRYWSSQFLYRREPGGGYEVLD